MIYKLEFFNFFFILLNLWIIFSYPDTSILHYISLYLCTIGCVSGTLFKIKAKRNQLVRELAE